MKDKIKIEELAPYLPYELGCEILNYQCDYVGIRYSKITAMIVDEGFDLAIQYKGGFALKTYPDYRPILRPLSDYKDLNSKAMVELNCDVMSQLQIADFANERIGLSGLSYTDACILFQNHVDVFGLIDRGLAVGINTLTELK